MVLNFRAVIKVLGILTLIEGLFMLPTLLIAMIFEEWSAASAFLTTALVCISIGFVILTQLKFDKIVFLVYNYFLVSWKRRLLRCLKSYCLYFYV